MRVLENPYFVRFHQQPDPENIINVENVDFAITVPVRDSNALDSKLAEDSKHELKNGGFP